MMMTSIPNNGQARLNLERLRAVRERIKQEQQQGVSTTATPRSTASPVTTSASPSFEKQLGTPVQSPPPKQQVTRENQQASHLEDTRMSVLNDAQANQVMTHNTALHPHVPPTAKRDLQPQGRFGLPLNDIQQVAEDSGFVGLSADAIERAYASRKSLFVDVKI